MTMGNSGNKKVLAKSLCCLYSYSIFHKKAKQIQKPPSKSNYAIVFCFLLKTTFKKIPRKSPWKHKYKETRGGSRLLHCALSAKGCLCLCCWF